jgi:tRNA(Ile)-lysidine synthase
MQIPGLDIFRSFGCLRIAPPGVDSLDNRNYRLPLPVPGAVQLPGQKAVVYAELFENTNVTEATKDVYNGGVGCLDWNRLSGSLEVRNWRPGDQYQRAGHAGPEKIKFLFHQARVPLWERRHWPVLTSGDMILWARRFGPAAGFAASPGTSTVLAIRETRG